MAISKITTESIAPNSIDNSVLSNTSITINGTEIGLGHSRDIPGANVTNIPNSSLANSSITINGTEIGLGQSGNITAGATITNDTSTNATRYVMLGSATSGAYTSANVSSTKLTFNPSTGILGSVGLNVSGGVANGVMYFDSNKNVVSGTQLSFNGTSLGISTNSPGTYAQKIAVIGNNHGGGNGSNVNGSVLPQVYFTGLGVDNSGSVEPISAFFHGNGGGGVPRGCVLGVTGSGSLTDGNLFFVSTGAPIFSTLYSKPFVGVYRGNCSSTNTPSSWSNAGGITCNFGIYDNRTGEWDGTYKTGVSVVLSGSYGGGSPGNWGGMCYAASVTTNFGSGSSGTNYGYYANITNAGSGNNWGLYIANGGAAKPGGGSFTATSDIRVKNVLGNYGRGLSDLISLSPVNYEYNGKGGHTLDNKQYTGLIAQDLQEVIPEMVFSRKDKLEESDEVDTDILMVDNSALIYVAINAIKELNQKFEDSQTYISQLEQRIQQLESKTI